MTIDLNSTKTRLHTFSNAVSAAIDATISQDARQRAVTRLILDLEDDCPEAEERWGRSISASAVGDECARRVQLGVWPTFHPDKPHPKKAPIDKKTAIVFARGHATETMMAGWLQEAGFDISLHTTNKDTGEEYQHGFSVAGGHIKGFADGIVHRVPPSLWGPEWLNIKPLWENKTLGNTGWRKAWNHGIAKGHPKYDAQAHLLMPYMNADATLFTLLNADTGEIYSELRLFDPHIAQATSDRAVDILKATRAGDLLPKAGTLNPDTGVPGYPCAFCRFRAECWG
jgi:hypothetical protein